MMDFFAQQDAARRASRRLLLAMAAAVICVVLAVDVAVAVCFNMWTDAHPPHIAESPLGAERQQQLLVQAVVWTSLVTLVVIAGGGLVATLGLRGGGRAVAESMGGREVNEYTATPEERRLLNVVEEMSIASGVPRPPVFVIDSEGINAFAAGFTPQDAAIGVTKGAIAQLPRDELQGVIGHEFSHILNGDMRLNMRLIATVAGLIAITAVGRGIMRVAFNSGSGSKKGSPLPLIIFGLILCVIGWLGWLAGRLIQSAFSRRREYLADASAVQFTRNPSGLAGALTRIAEPGIGSAMPSRLVKAEFAHLFFSDSIAHRLTSLFATHPPLQERIARLAAGPLPRTASVPASTASTSAPTASSPVSALAGAGPAIGMMALNVGAAAARPAVEMHPTAVITSAGAISLERVRFGAALLARLPGPLAQAAREPVSARAAAILTLLHHEPIGADRQISIVHNHDPWLAAEVRRLQPHWFAVDRDAARLPLLQLAAPALGSMSPRQRAGYLNLVETLAREDGVLTLREFCVLRRLHLILDQTRPSRPRVRLRDCRDEAVVFLGALAQCAGLQEEQQRAFATGWSRLPIPGAPPALPPPSACGPTALGAAFDRLGGLDAAGMRSLVDAGAHAVAADGTVNAREAELLRLGCDALGVPLPPFADAA